MKRCTNCNTLKNSECFRIRTEKRYGYEKSFTYLNNTCKDCDSLKAKEYREKIKNTPEYKEANKQRSKKYRKDNISIVLEKDKIKRQSEGYKLKRKKYREKNKVKIYNQEKIRKKIYHEKNRDALTDIYVVSKIINKSILSKNEIPIDLIKLKRLEIICKRSLKTIKNESQTTTR